jgi:hypothetical protein
MRSPLSTGSFPLFFALVSLLALSGHCLAEVKLYGSEVMTQTKEIKGEVWPEVTAQALIKASPLTSAAIFAAYDYQKNYIPNLLESKVTFEKVEGKTNDTHVTYKMDMPWPIGDSDYVHGHELTSPAPHEYKVRWYMIKSDSADNVRGYALFRPHPGQSGYTIMTYVSLVSPKSFLAGIFKKIMVKDVVKSIEAVRSTTENLVKTNPELVDKYQDKIRQVLAGKPAYLK